MALLLIGGTVLSGIFVAVWRTIVSDGYGVRPPPRSHHGEEDLNQVTWRA